MPTDPIEHRAKHAADVTDVMKRLGPSEDFSLVLGGPLYQIWRRTRLTGDGLQLLRRRVVALTVLAWVPLLVLSIVEGRAWGERRAAVLSTISSCTSAFCVALPLLILAELVVHRRMRPVVRQFLERGLIPDSAPAAVRRGHRRRRCACATRSGPRCCSIAFVYVVGVGIVWRTQIALHVASWHGAPVNGTWQPSLAGWWLGAGEPAAVPVPAAALVFPAVHLGALPVAGVAHRVDAHADASGPLRRPGLPRRASAMRSRRCCSPRGRCWPG